MTPSFGQSSARDTRRGLMLMTAMRKASNEKYRLYAEAKSRIPLDLPPAEYEAEIERLAKKYRI